MPIYEYQCTSCQHEFDEIQKMSDPVITLCPECSQETVIRLVSAAGFQLKGTGWYVTDFKDKGKAKTTSESSSTKSSEKKTETVASSTTSKSTESKGGDK